MSTAIKASAGRYVIQSVSQMERLAKFLSKERSAGDVFFLNGDIGMGKSCFARAYVRSAMKDDRLRVPSPTFLLMNSYKSSLMSNNSPLWIHHMDFYRLQSLDVADYDTFDLKNKFRSDVSLIEWAERMKEELKPKNRIELSIELGDEDSTISSQSFEEESPRVVGFDIYGKDAIAGWNSRYQDILDSTFQ